MSRQSAHVNSFANATLDFPAVRLESGAEFQQFRKETQPVFDARWLYEQSLGSREAVIPLEGTCGVCVAPSTFSASTEHGEVLSDQRRVPNWRETLACGCEYGLVNRHRAVLHFLIAKGMLSNWTRLLAFGPVEALAKPLAQSVGRFSAIARIDRQFGDAIKPRYRLDAGDASFHAALALDYLQRVPPLDEALAEIHRILVSGGNFVFTLPFRVTSPSTVSYLGHLPRNRGLLPAEFAGEVHEIGWDILDRLRAIGFAKAATHLYWSEELGYLGPYNFIFSACK
jgi:SAM-dependent methyltransferase